MKIFLNPYVQLIILFCLVVIFTSFIGFENYPDYKILEERLQKNYHELNFTIQKLLVKILRYITDADIFKMSDYTNISFFLPSFFICSIIVFVEAFVVKVKKINMNRNLNFYYLTTLSFPSVLLSITAISSEAVYTIISLYVVSKINFNKGPFLFSIMTILLLMYSFFLDKGNSVVLLSFLLGYICLSFLIKYTNIRIFLFSLPLIMIFVLYIGPDVFMKLGLFLESKKIENIIGAIQDRNLQYPSMYELILRVGYFWITLTSLNFGDKSFSYLAIICYISLIFILVKKLRDKKNLKTLKKYFLSDYNLVLFIWVILFPFLFIYILPTHAYAKYCLFMIVILLKPFIHIFEKINVYLFVILFSLFSIFERFLLL